MKDLTLKEALTQYEAECREVLGGAYYCYMCIRESNMGILLMRTRELIGACMVWLAGAGMQPGCPRDVAGIFGHWPTEPLRFLLEEVRAHMEDECTWRASDV